MTDKILIDGRICTLKQGAYRDLAVIPPDGYLACRTICEGSCRTASMLEDGSCPCAPGDHTAPVIIRPNTAGQST